MSVIADGVDEIRRAAREELRKGAAQIKIFASGGVVFPAEGHATRHEFSDAELRAAMEAAAARGTYVMAHVDTDEGVRRCLAAGVRSIEHANFVSEETVAMIGAAGAFLLPTFISLVQRVESATTHSPAPAIVANLQRSIARGRQVDAWARKHGVSIGLDTELWGRRRSARSCANSRCAATWTRLRPSCARPPPPMPSVLMHAGRLGTLAEGACADLLVVECDPLSDIGVLLDPQRNLKFIMKGGVVYKNELPA
jgi:imidazolonepropionase-like amidohydrolase